MTKFNPFRVSFDRPLGDSERKRARIAATVVSATALVLGVASVSTLLNASSATVAAWTNAAPEPEVRLLALEGEDPAGKPCDDQTWPYIEQRCLKPADSTSAERSTPKHGLAAQSVILPSAPVPAVTPPPAVATETTGAASPRDDDAAPMKDAKASAQPAPIGSARTRPDIGTDAASQRLDAKPQLSPREARRLQREERKQIQRERREQALQLRRERREEAKRAREERVKARAEAREARRKSDGDRIVRRWSEYTYETPNGRNQRVIVIRRGSLDDDFFRTVR
jgi:hypothetical protein